MATAFFDRNRTTLSKSYAYPEFPAAPSVALASVKLPQKVALLTRVTDAWAMVERAFETTPINVLVCSDDQWGQTFCPTVADVLERTWEQAALVASHIALYNTPKSLLISAATVRPGVVDLLFNLYYTHREIVRALTELDEPLLQPTHVAVRSIRAQIESLIQYYYLSTEQVRRLKTTQPCSNNPKCYPWRCDRIW